MRTMQLACDVLVVGAGVSGVAAAISASRAQANTILIEKNNYPGGIAIDCRHRYLCGLYPKNTGIANEIIKSLQRHNRQNKFTRIGKLSVFSFAPKDLQLTLNKLIKNEKNLKVLYNRKITQVKIKASTIISLQTPASSLDIKPKVVIDASGEGSIIKLSGAKYQLAPLAQRQLAGFTFGICKITDQSDSLAIKVPYYLRLGVKQNEIPAYFKFTNFAYDEPKNTGIIKLNLPPEQFFQKKLKTKKIAALIHAFLVKKLPEFKQSRISWVASNIHEREGVRLAGEHILTKQEILSAKKFSNSIAKGYWPMEFWHQKQGQRIEYFKAHKFYQIPLGCLKSRNITNLFATGKCISATSEALASSRVMGTCIYLGEAAGRACAE